MAPAIRISDDTFARLQSLAQPLVDTPDSVIARLLDAALATNGSRSANTVAMPSPSLDAETGMPEFVGLEIDPVAPDNLTHTRVRYARFGDHVVEQPNWNEFMRAAHVIALKALGSIDALRKATTANVRQGSYTGEGFSFIPEAGISIQGADANKAWQHSLRLARKLGVSLEVRFEWYAKESAAHPGKAARLRWAPMKK